MTVYRGKTAETYVGAVRGPISDEDCEAMADAFKVDEDEEDAIGFQEVELAEEPRELPEVLQAFP